MNFDSGTGSTFRAPRLSHSVWCTSAALHHDHGAVTMNIPVEQVKNLKKEQDDGKRSSLLFSTNFSLRTLAHLFESVRLPLAIVAEEMFAQLVG